MTTPTSRSVRTLRLTITLALASALTLALGATTSPTAAQPAAAARSSSDPVTLITQNIRYGPGQAKDRRLLAHLNGLGADYLLVQEARDVNLSRALPSGLRHNQVLTNNGTKGSAVVWRNSVGGITARPLHQIVRGKRYGIGMNRYASVVDTTVQGKPTRIISVHYAPRNKSRTWAATHAHVRSVISRRPAGSEYIVGGDFNQMYSNMPRHLGGRSYGERIDGFVVSHGLEVTSVGIDRFGKKIRATDHRAVRITVSRR